MNTPMDHALPSSWHERRHSPDPSPRPDDHRSPSQRDKARILHSAAFRRLQAKTQIMGVGQNDFYRTRLTHSLEAAQIGTALVAQLQRKAATDAKASALLALLPSDSLMEALCLAHDIGHPPFGHGGEYALHACMLAHGGFEGNAQTLRIVGKLEPYTREGGMDLSRRTLLGLLKYPILQQPQQPPQSGAIAVKPTKAIYAEDADLLQWILAPLSAADQALFTSEHALPQPPFRRSIYKSLDASIMELADDIAYGVHDLEDAIATGTVSHSQWQQQLSRWDDPDAAQLCQQVKTQLMDYGNRLFAAAHFERKNAIGALVNQLITAVSWHQVLPQAQSALLQYNAVLPEPALLLLNFLKRFIFTNVILQSDLQQLEFRGQQMVNRLFQAFASDPLRLLPANTQQRYQVYAAQGGDPMRVICDYIAGMTDAYAKDMFIRLYGAHS